MGVNAKSISTPMISKPDLAVLIDAYAAAKVSGNEYLITKIIDDLQEATDGLYATIESFELDGAQPLKQFVETENDA